MVWTSNLSRRPYRTLLAAKLAAQRQYGNLLSWTSPRPGADGVVTVTGTDYLSGEEVTLRCVDEFSL